MKKIWTLVLSLVLSVSCVVALGVEKVSKKAFAATDGNIAVQTEYAGDQSFYYKTTLSGAVTVEYDIAFACFQDTVFGFGLTADANSGNPYNSGLFFANSQTVYTPWRPTGLANPTAYQNYNENFWGVQMYFRVRIKMEVNADGDVVLYAKSIEPSATYSGSNPQITEYVQITDELTEHFKTEVSAESYTLGFFFRNSSNTSVMHFYGFKATCVNGTVVEERFTSAKMFDTFWTGAIESSLADGKLVYTQAIPEPEQENVELEMTSAPVFVSGDGYGLPYLVFTMNTTAAQWTAFAEQLANVEYCRADGTKETLNNIVVIDSVSHKVQVRLADSGEWTLKDGDRFTVKSGFTLVENEMLLERVKEDVSFVYSAEERQFVTPEAYAADKCGAMVIKPEYVDDGVMTYRTVINGASNVYIDLDVSNLTAFGVGFMTKPDDSSPYASKLFFMTKEAVYTPWATSFLSSFVKYENDFTMCETTLKISVEDNGDTTVYALAEDTYIRIIDTIPGMYRDEISNGMYLSMFARTGASSGYIYKITVTDQNDRLVAKTDFAYDKLNTETFSLNGAVGIDFAGAKTMLSWRAPTGKYIPVPEVEIMLGGVEKVTEKGNEVNLTPVVNNLTEEDRLSITVADGETEIAVENGVYTFEKAGVYIVTYRVTGEDGAVKKTAQTEIIVNEQSTQPTAMTNFDQGYFDGRNFEVVGNAGVADGALLIKTEEKAAFITKGYSESFIMTFDVTKYVSGEISLVLGKINDNAYVITFKADGTIVMGEQNFTLPMNIYDRLASGTTVTIRAKLAAKAVDVYVRVSDTSVENIDISLASFTGINVTGKVGVCAEVAAEFVVDNFRFVSLTSVKGENTGEPENSQKPVTPDQPDDPIEPKPQPETSCSSCASSVFPNGVGGLGGIIASVLAIVLATAFFATAALKKNKTNKQ